ncbi:LytR/AlgR family response regulator transcription factor [Spirosoma spitsbergense]|uniref:LytR/AlgR family response regulator transcription factor n=1 Tax=Spirosoma spitsbergense TaxID=431554 RepID=UPI000364B69C|nr:LytTR family DNA-binding domain-containing protein [Spirosoma spitsbergense]
MTILIVEDEPKSARMLQELIESVRDGARVLGICSSIEETVQFLTRAQSPDLIFMDIELADGNSFDIFNQVTITAPVIFCTAYDNYVLDAFKANGIDYLLKPVEKQHVQTAFAKLDTIRKALAPNVLAVEQFLMNLQDTIRNAYNTSFLVRIREKMLPIAVADIAAVEFEHEVSCLHTLKNEKYPLFKTMDEIEAVLNPAQFFRINRQMIVHRRAIVFIEPHFNRKVTLTLSCKLSARPIVSRLKVTSFLNWVEKQ